MRWHCLQHVPFEGPGHLATWAQRKGYALSSTKLWQETDFPQLDEFDGLFILGGPMNVYEVDHYPWLASEQQFIARAITSHMPILGVCLGAQLLAVVLGGLVTQNLETEIGWFPVELAPAGRGSSLFHDFPDSFMAFHWHRDCFSIPPGAVRAARSKACRQQAFVFEERVVGLQFHLESTERSIAALTHHCGADVESGQIVQDRYAIHRCAAHVPTAHLLLDGLLDRLQSLMAKSPATIVT
jgi:GMP synthase (glutamine-hydrolysing)